MTKPHIFQRGDTLAKIAAARLGDAKLARLLADYNGLASTREVVVGQAIHLPPKADLAAAKAPQGKTRARAAGPINPWPPAPNGMAAIIATFGDIRPFAREDGTPNPAWEAQSIARATLPFSIPLSFDPSKSVTRIAVHKLLVPLFERVFADIAAQGLRGSIRTYGGGYTWRMKRGQSKPSTHTWGLAIDLNDRTNAMGTAGDMNPALVALFEGYGFVWGGRWSGSNKDPMHFQYCSGY